MFEFKADAQEFYNKVAKPVVESDSALPHGRAVEIKGVNRSSATPGGAKLRGVSYKQGSYYFT